MYLKISNKNYSFRYKIPIDLREYFHGRYELIVSLKTKDVKLAKTKAMRLGADTKDFLQRIRWMMNMGLDNIDELVSNWLADKLQRDFNARIHKSTLEGYSACDLPAQKNSDYSDNILRQLKDDMKYLRLNRMQLIASEILDGKLDAENPQHKELMFKLLQANVALFNELKERNDGNFNFELIKYQQQHAAPERSLTYGEAIDKYESFYTYKSNSQAEIRDVMRFFKNIFLNVVGKDTDVAKTIDDLMETLEEIELLPIRSGEKFQKGMTKEEVFALDIKSIDISTYAKFVKWIKSFFKWLHDQRSIPTNIANSIKSVDVNDASTLRSGFTNAEVMAIFELAKSTNEDLYIMLKVLAYTGMRHSEFFKMNVGYDHFDLTDRAEKLKTHSAYRKIPMHSALRDIAPEKIYEIQQKYDAQQLSRIGMKLIRQITEDPKKVVYSFRHTVSSKFRGKVDETKAAEILGHLRGNSITYQRYGDPTPLEELKKIIEFINFELEVSMI